MSGQLIGTGPREEVVTARLRLERWHDAHFERFARFMRDPDVIRYIRAEPLDGAKAIVQHEQSLAEWEENGFGKRAVIESDTDEWLGFVELSRVGPGKGCRDEDVEIGYFVAPSRWGQGIATEAASAARDEAFDDAGLDELIGRCRVENTASARVLEKLGFRLLRPHLLPGGIVVDIHRLRRENWPVPADRRPRGVRDGRQHGGSDYRENG